MKKITSASWMALVALLTLSSLTTTPLLAKSKAKEPAAGSPDSICADKTDEGEDLRDEGSYQEAESVLKEAAKACENSNVRGARPYIALGKTYYEQKRYNEALTQFQKASAKEPDLPLAYLNMGAAYIGMGQYQKAIDACKKGIPLAKGDEHMLYMLNGNIQLAQSSLGQ